MAGPRQTSPNRPYSQKNFAQSCVPENGITARGQTIGADAMRGKSCAGLRLALLAAALLGAGAAAALAKDAPAPATGPGLPSTIIVLDASSSMNEKVGGASKITTVRTELG